MGSQLKKGSYWDHIGAKAPIGLSIESLHLQKRAEDALLQRLDSARACYSRSTKYIYVSLVRLTVRIFFVSSRASFAVLSFFRWTRSFFLERANKSMPSDQCLGFHLPSPPTIAMRNAVTRLGFTTILQFVLRHERMPLSWSNHLHGKRHMSVSEHQAAEHGT